MKRYTLDLAHMQSSKDAYDHLIKVFKLPTYFGRNLDALEECINDLTHTEGNIVIAFVHNTPKTRSKIFNAIVEVLSENHSISFI